MRGELPNQEFAKIIGLPHNITMVDPLSILYHKINKVAMKRAVVFLASGRVCFITDENLPLSSGKVMI